MAVPDVDLLLAHEGFLKGIAKGLVADDALAKDVVQETYLAALSDAPRQDLRAWLGGVARNLSRMALRSEARRRRREQLRAIAAPAVSVPDAIARLELQREVVGAVLALEEPYRATVLFRHFYDLPLEEIAGRMRVPLETVRTRLRRGLERLRSGLDATHGGERGAWLAPLLATVATRASRVPAAVTGGAIAMSKTKLALGAALLLILGLAAYELGGRGGLAPARSTPGGPAGAGEHAARPVEEAAETPAHPVDTRERGWIRVVDQANAPLEGVAVLAVSEADLKGPTGERSWYWTEPDLARSFATSDAEGRVAVPERPGTLLWLKAGFEPQVAAEKDVAPGLVVILFRGRTLEGRVTDTEGRPIAGARVVTIVETRIDLPRRQALADTAGEYRFLYLPAEIHGIAARAMGYVERRRDEVGPATRLDLTLVRATLLVDVTDRESDTPVGSAGALVLRPDGAFLAGLVADETRSGRLLLDESVGHWHADAGPLDLNVFAPGHRTFVQRIELRAGKEPPHVLAALVRGNEEPVLSGRVIAEAPAEVEVHARSPQGFVEMPDNRLPVIASAPCAADGAFAFGGLPPGRYRLVARAQRVGEKGIDVEAPARDLEIELRPAATLVVQAISLDGEPATNAWIHVEQVGGRFWCRRTGPDGRAKFEDLPAGRFRVFPRPTETQQKMTSTVAGKEELDLAAGQVGGVTVRVPSPVTFTYVVADETGAPWADATLTLRPNLNDYAQILEEGRFYALKLTTNPDGVTTASLFPGMYDVTVRAGPVNRRAWLAVPMERNGSVRITLPRHGKAVSGHVTDGVTHEAIPGRPIYVYDLTRPDEGWIADGVTGPDGAYGLEGLPAGPVRIHLAPNLTPDRCPYPDNVYAGGYAEIDLRADAGPLDIALARETTPKTVECRIHLTDAKTGAPLENAGANAYGLVGTTWIMAGWARTDADGQAKALLLPAKRYRITANGPFGADPPYVRQDPEIDGAESGTLTLDVALERAADD